MEAQVEVVLAMPTDIDRVEATQDLHEGGDSPKFVEGAPAIPISLSEADRLIYL